MCNYIKTRAPKSIKFKINNNIKKKHVLGDRTLLDWAFQNIIINSVDAISNNDNYYVSTDLATPYGFEYNREFVLDRVAPSAGSKTTRDANTKLDKTKVQTEADGNLNSNFYHEINTNTFAGDTLLWHSKFKFIGITADGTGPAYTGNATAIINEAGIFNKSHTDSGNTDPIEDVIMLARRTFSEKPVKIDDELTIKWQITIK